MAPPQFLFGLLVFCSGITWILADLINDGNATVANTTSSELSDLTRREELDQFYAHRAESDKESMRDENENSLLKPTSSLRKVNQPLYPVEELTGFLNEVPCDNAQFLLRILTVMLPLLKNEVPESSRTSYILLILKDLLKSSPEASKDYDVLNKVNDLILALEKYHENDEHLDYNPSSALRKRNNEIGLPDGIQSKVIFQYEVPNLPNPSCTAEIVHIVNVVQKAIVDLVNNPRCKSIVPIEVPFFINFEENLKPNLYLPSKDDTQKQDKVPGYWGDDNRNEVEEIMIANKLKEDQGYPSNQPDLIDDDVKYLHDDSKPDNKYQFVQTYPTNPTDFYPYYDDPKKPSDYSFEPNPFDDRNWRYYPVNPEILNYEMQYPGSSNYFDLFQLSTPSTFDKELDKFTTDDYNNLIPGRPYKGQPDANYPEITFPFKTDDERNPAFLLPYNLKKYYDNMEIISNTDKPGLPIIDTTGEPQTAYIPLGPHTPVEDEIYYIRPGQQPINLNRYDKLPSSRPSIIGKTEPFNTPRYPSNTYVPNWPYNQDNLYTIADVHGAQSEIPIEFDNFGQQIRPEYPTKVENPIQLYMFEQPIKPKEPTKIEYPSEFGRPKRMKYPTTENPLESDIFGRPIRAKYITTTENTIEFDNFGRPKRPKYSTTESPIEFDIFDLPKRPKYPNVKKPSPKPRPITPKRPRPNSPDNWPDNVVYDDDYTVTPDLYPEVYESLDKHPKMPLVINPIQTPTEYSDKDAAFDYAEQKKPNSWNQNSDTNNDSPHPDGKTLQIIKDNIDVIINKIPVHKLSPELFEKIIKLKKLLDLDQITVEEYISIINKYQIIIEKVKHMDINNALMKDFLFSMTNLDKLDLATGKSKLIEFTYLVKRPRPLIYQPYYYIKYRLPYNLFLQRIEKMLAKNPQLTNYPAKLYEAMIPISQVHETSPDLNAYGDDDILRLTFDDGTLVGAKVVKGKDKDIHNAIEQLKQINSDLSVDDTYKLIKNLESKLKHTPEGLFVENSNLPALNLPEKYSIKVNNKPILKKFTKITTNKIGANKVISDILNKYNYLRSKSRDEGNGKATITTTTNTSLEETSPSTSDIPNVARSRYVYSSYINEQSDMNKHDIPEHLQSVNSADELKFDSYPSTSDITKSQTLQDVEYIKLSQKDPSSYIYNPNVPDEDVTKVIDTEFDDTQNKLKSPISYSKTIVKPFNYNEPKENSHKQLYNSDTHFLESPLGLVSKSEYIISNSEPINSYPTSQTKTYISKPNEESVYSVNSNIAGIEFEDTHKLLRKANSDDKIVVNDFNHQESNKNTQINQMYDSSKSEYVSNPEPSYTNLISHSRTYINGIPVEHTKTYRTINGNSDNTKVFQKPTMSRKVMQDIYKSSIKAKENIDYDKDFKDLSLAHGSKSDYVSSPYNNKLRLVKHSQSYVNGYPVEHSKTYVTNRDSGHLENIMKSYLDAEHFKTGGGIANVIDKDSLLENYKPISNDKSLETLIDKKSLLENYKPADNNINGIDTLQMMKKEALIQNLNPIDRYKIIGSHKVLYDTNANSLAQNPSYINNQYLASNYNQEQGNLGLNLQQNNAGNGQTYTAGSYISGNDYNIGNIGTRYRYIMSRKPRFVPSVTKVIRRPFFG